MTIAGRTSNSFQSANTTPHEGLKNMLDLAEVISELKAVIAQQNKLLEQLSKNTTNGCEFVNGQYPQPQQRQMLFGNPAYGMSSPPSGFVFNGSFNGPNNNHYQNQTAVQPNVDTLPIWHKPYIPIHCLLDCSKEHKDVPREFKLALVNSTIYKVPPVTTVCHYKPMVGEHEDWALQLLTKLKHHVGQGWCIVGDSIFDLPAGTLIHRNSGLNEGGILYRIPEFQYPDPVSEKSWF